MTEQCYLRIYFVPKAKVASSKVAKLKYILVMWLLLLTLLPLGEGNWVPFAKFMAVTKRTS